MNAKKFDAHKCVGGQFSPEMELPKLRWLKKNLPHRWSHVAYAFDLVDFLTWKCTGETSRSSCSLVCKWGWIPSGNGSAGDWEEALIQWSELTELRDIARGTVLFPGAAAGAGGGMRKVSRALQVMQAMQFLRSAVGDYISFSNTKKSLCLALM